MVAVVADDDIHISHLLAKIPRGARTDPLTGMTESSHGQTVSPLASHARGGGHIYPCLGSYSTILYGSISITLH